MVSKILLALDDSIRAPRVAAAGGLLAAKFGASLHLVRVIPARTGVSTHDAIPESQLQETRTALGEIARSLMDALVAPPTVRIGEPWRVILEHATELGADLIVLGARGHSDQSLGSTAAAVLANSAQNIFVVRDARRSTT